MLKPDDQSLTFLKLQLNISLYLLKNDYLREKITLKMRTINNSILKGLLFWTLVMGVWGVEYAFGQSTDEAPGYTEYRGKVVDANTNNTLEKVQITLNQTNIGSITNSEGEFLLKVPKAEKEQEIRLTKVGYNQKFVRLSVLGENSTIIALTPSEELLDQVELYESVNPRRLVEEALKKPDEKGRYLTGFYREGVTRGTGRNVLLAEAVIEIDQKKSMGGKHGRIELYKSRKNTDYQILDTTAVKLKGGPYNPLYSNVVRYPEFLFYGQGKLDNFSFHFEDPTTLSGRYVFVVHFEDNNKREPWTFGRIYIDAKTNALLRIEYQLNVDNQRQAERMLVAKKPRDFSVTPLEVGYEANYLLTQESSYFNYGSFFIKLRVKKKGRLFNRRFSVKSELLITDRKDVSAFPEKDLTRIRPSSIISDDIQGFGEPDFWGENNIIEPERSLERTFNSIWRRYQRHN